MESVCCRKTVIHWIHAVWMLNHIVLYLYFYTYFPNKMMLKQEKQAATFLVHCLLLWWLKEWRGSVPNFTRTDTWEEWRSPNCKQFAWYQCACSTRYKHQCRCSAVKKKKKMLIRRRSASCKVWCSIFRCSLSSSTQGAETLTEGLWEVSNCVVFHFAATNPFHPKSSKKEKEKKKERKIQLSY